MLVPIKTQDGYLCIDDQTILMIRSPMSDDGEDPKAGCFVDFRNPRYEDRIDTVHSTETALQARRRILDALRRRPGVTATASRPHFLKVRIHSGEHSRDAIFRADLINGVFDMPDGQCHILYQFMPDRPTVFNALGVTAADIYGILGRAGLSDQERAF